MSTIRGDWANDRTLEPRREARAAELAGRLASMLDGRHAGGPQEMARLLVEVPRLPAEAQKSFLAALTGASEGGPREWAQVRERIERAYPESSDKRRELGAALVSLEGGEAGAQDPSVLEAKVSGAIARLGAFPSPGRTASLDTMEPARRFGSFGGPAGPQDSERTFSTQPTYRIGDLVGASSSAGLVESAAAAGDVNALDALPERWRQLLERAQAMAPGLGSAVASIGHAEGAVAAAQQGLAQRVEEAHEEGFWDHLRMVASERAMGSIAARLGAMRERLAGGFEAASALGNLARGQTLATMARVLRGEAALVRQDVASARDLLPDLELPQVGSARSALGRADGQVRDAEYGLQAYEAQQHIVSSVADAAAGAESVVAGSGGETSEELPAELLAQGALPSGVGTPSARITEEELDRLGSGLTPPPAQGFWNIGTVGAGMDPAVVHGEEYCRCSGDAVNRLIGNGTSVREIEGAELVAAIRDMGVPLETVDPSQVEAALNYVNTGGAGAVAEFGRGAPKTVDEQRERLALTLRQFRYLSEHGPAAMDRETAINVMWSAARIPGHAFEKMSDAEVLSTAQQVAAACNTPGSHELKVGKHTVKLEIGEGNTVLATSTKAPSAWSKIGGIAKVALTVASFIPGPIGLVARGIQAGIALVNAVRHGGGLLDVVAAGASFVGAGAAAVSRLARAGSSVARIAGNVARVAQSFSGTVRGVQGIQRGGLSGVVSGAAGVAQGFSGALQGGGMAASSPLVNATADVGRALSWLGAGLGAAEGYIHANRAVNDAREALERARATGDLAQVRLAEEQLAGAERAKRSAVLGGLATVGQIAGDTLSRNSQGQNDPRAGEVPGTGRSGFQVGAEIFSRGMSTARGLNEDDLLSAGVEALGGLAAARQGTKALQEERVIGPDGLPIPLKDEFGNSLIDEHGHRLYQTTNDFNLLNEASSVLDGLSDWRQAARGESQARDAVGQAEQALALARASGDSGAIREAEANLDASRHGLVRAELDRTLAQDNAASRFTGAVDTYKNSRAADQLRAEQERQSERAAASLDGAKGLGRSLGTLAGLEALGEDARARLEEQAAALAAGEAAYLDALDRAEGDPAKIQKATEAFARLQETVRAEGRSIVEEDQARVAAVGGPGAAGSNASGSDAAGPGAAGASAAGPNASSAGAPPASFGVATVRAGMTVWEISMRTGVPVDRILDFNAQGGNALDPHHLKEGQQVYVPLGASDVQARPRTTAEVQMLKDQANGVNYFEGIRFRSPAEVEGDFARAASLDGPAPPAGPPRPVEEPSALDFIWRDFDWRSVGQSAFDAAADIGDSVGAFAQGFGSGVLDMAKGAVVGGVELAKLAAMQTMGTPEQRFQATMALTQMGIGAAEHLVESGRYLVHGVKNPGDVLDAMNELGIKGSAYELGRSTASAEGTVSSLYGMAGPIRSLGRRLLSEADEAAEAAARTSAGEVGEIIEPESTASGKPEWLLDVEQGTNFNKAHAFDYPYREVYIERPGGGYYVLDAYDPFNGEIVSRKMTDFSEISHQTATEYLSELARKYSPNARIGNVPSSGPIAGQPLRGQMILEVPPQPRGIPRLVLDYANAKRIVIRDIYGHVYN